MKILRNQLLLFGILLVGAAGEAAGQSLADSSGKKNQTAIKLGIFYNSYLHYYGRTDSLQSGGVFPLAEIWFDEHFYISAAPVFVTNKRSNFDYAGTVTMAGYRFGKENKSNWNFYIVKPIYKDNSQLVQSALKAQLSGTGTWLNKFLNLTLGGDIKLSEQIDLGAQAGIDHIFRKQFRNSSVLVVDPAFYINAGTQRFTKTYYKQSSFLFFPGVQQEVTEKVSKFNVLSYEVSMPVIFAKGRLQFLFTPAFVIPQNLVAEKGENKFYGVVGAKVRL